MTQQPGMGDPYGGGGGYEQQPYGQQAPYGQAPYGQQVPGYPQQQPYGQMVPYQQPMVAQPVMMPMQVKPKTNGLAVASMVVALVGLFFVYFAFILQIVALILGIIAKKQIKDKGEGGNGMATAGIVIASIILGITVIGGLVVILAFGGLGLLGLGASS